MHGLEERFDALVIFNSRCRLDTGGDVDTEGPYALDGLADVRGCETACEQYPPPP
jgi:hypothetical protein